jgi:hypothetical protein
MPSQLVEPQRTPGVPASDALGVLHARIVVKLATIEAMKYSFVIRSLPVSERCPPTRRVFEKHTLCVYSAKTNRLVTRTRCFTARCVPVVSIERQSWKAGYYREERRTDGWCGPQSSNLT